MPPPRHVPFLQNRLLLVTLDRLGQRYGVNPVTLLDGDLLDWGLLMAISQAGAEQDRIDREKMKAEAAGKAYAGPVEGETPLSAALKRRKRRG